MLFTLAACYGEVSVVEIPIRVDSHTAKRVPGTMDFYIIFRDPQGTVIAIPEQEVSRFIQLAIDEGFDKAEPDTYNYLSWPNVAVGNTQKAVITIEHTDQLSFWLSDDKIFITWDDEHPAPLDLLDGVPIETYLVGSGPLPTSPQPLFIK